jgi:hypothetical protein
VFDSGVEAPGWPVRIGAAASVYGGPIVESADADWRDVIYGTGEALAWALHDDGSDLGGWPARLPSAGLVTPASGDLDGDGSVDVVMPAADDLVVFSTGAPLQRTLTLGQWPMEGHDPMRTGCLCTTEGVTAVASEVPAPPNRLAAPVPYPARAGQPVRLRFALATTARVTLELFDIAGRRAATLLDGSLAAGEHVAMWDTRLGDGGPAPPGVYLARLEVDDTSGRSRSARPLLILH